MNKSNGNIVVVLTIAIITHLCMFVYMHDTFFFHISLTPFYMPTPQTYSLAEENKELGHEDGSGITVGKV